MAHNMKTLWRLSKGAINNTLFRNTVFNASNGRYIFTPTVLKIVEYEKERHLTRAQYMGVESTFRGKMSSVCESPTGKVYMEDLKAMLYMAQKDDIPLLVKMIEKYNHTQHHKFVFGPVIMRTLYFVDDPNTALELYNNPELSSIFNKQSAQTILMTLLYDHAMYDSVIDVWKKIEAENQGDTVGSKSTRILLFASLAKKNTPDALELATTLWQKMLEMRTFVTREISLYLYMLLQHNKPEEVIREIMDTNVPRNHLIHFKILALLDLEKYDEAYEEMNNIILECGRSRVLIFRDMAHHIANISDNNEAKAKLQQAFSSIPRQNIGRSTIDEFIFIPINVLSSRGNSANQNRSFKEKLLSKAM